MFSWWRLSHHRPDPFNRTDIVARDFQRKLEKWKERFIKDFRAYHRSVCQDCTDDKEIQMANQVCNEKVKEKTFYGDWN